MDIAEYLDAVKAALDCANDAELARRLGVPQSRLSQYRSGKVFPNADMARIIARTIGIDPSVILNDIRREKARRNP